MSNYKLLLVFISLFTSFLLTSLPFSMRAVAAEPSGEKSKIRYVSDNIAITMRSGASSKYRVIQTLNSGEKLRVLEAGKPYSLVKTSSGKEGWVLSQYLAEEPAARQQLPTAIEKIAMLEEQNKEFKQQLNNVTRERNDLQTVAAKFTELQQRHKQLMEETSQLRKTASSQSELLAQAESLSKKSEFLQNQLDMALNENKELRDETRKQWFLIGSGVVLVSMLFGLVLGRGRKSKKSLWASSTDTLMLRQP